MNVETLICILVIFFVVVRKFLLALSSDWARFLRFVVETGTFTFDSTMSRQALGGGRSTWLPYFMGTMVSLLGGTASGA